MSFPRPAGGNGSPLTSVSCQVIDQQARARLLSRVAFLATKLPLPKLGAARSASLIYIGLWHLRQSYETKSQLAERDQLLDAIRIYSPGPGKSINVSYYNAWEQRRDGAVIAWPAHRPAIDAAMNAFLPDVKALKTRCLALVDLGARIGSSAGLPETEAWLEEFGFDPFL